MFDAERISVGRAPDNMLCLGEGALRVSSHHAEVTRLAGQFVLRDLGSTNGTMINGRRVVVGELGQDDLIEFGAGGPLLRFSVESNTEEDSLATVSTHPLKHENSIASAAASDQTAGPRPVALKTNATLIAALIGAMLLGGIGGIAASSRFRASDPEAMSFAEVAQLNSPAVVFIRTEYELLDSSGRVTTTEALTGSGFVVSDTGLIITNRHLVRDLEHNTLPPGTTVRITRIEAILPHLKSQDAEPAEVYRVGADRLVDVAVLKIGSLNPSVVHGIEPDVDNTNQGDEVVVIGYPLGLDILKTTNDTTVDPSLSTGVVSRVGHDFIQLNLRAYHGNSGGPVINRKGEVIGILTGHLNSAPEIALCIPISAALALVKDEIPRPQVSPATGSLRRNDYLFYATQFRQGRLRGLALSGKERN